MIGWVSIKRKLSVTGFIGLTILSGCSSVPGPDKSAAGAVLGAAWGAGAGAVIGNQKNARGHGAAVGAGFGAVSGLLTGIGLDVAEGTELQLQREVDALRVQVASNEQNFLRLQDELDGRGRIVRRVSTAEPIYFDQGRASLRVGTVAQLERIVALLKMNPYVRGVEVHGHSDDAGTAEENLRLSSARARTVSTFLAEHGFPLDRIRAVAHGSALPVATNATPEGKQLNRRVEVVLVR